MGFLSFLARRKKENKSSHEKSLEEGSSGSSISSVPLKSKTQSEELECVFKRFDVNGDGKISWSELGSIMRSLGYNATEEELKKMVKEVDADGDGFIDLNEFIEMNTKEVDSAKVIGDLKNAFMVYDLDGNGVISPEELQKVLRSLGERGSLDECKRMIRGVDRDGDGQINFEEFKVMMMGSAFGSADIAGSSGSKD